MQNLPVYRIGEGHDIHRTTEGRPLILGGITVCASFGLDGHSDADVLLHAITDAILGAAAIGDIGELFPDTDEANRGRDSAEMLKLAYGRVVESGCRVVNLDCIVFAQRPKLSSFKQDIRQRIASILEIAVEAVGVKAKAGEGVDSVGKEEAIMAQCVVLLQSN